MPDDFAGAATRGAAACRQALAAHRGQAAPTTKATERPLGDLLRARKPDPAQPPPAVNPFDAYKPRTTAPVGMPVYVDPNEDIPWPDEPPPEDWL